jgi:hypothetical protein
MLADGFVAAPGGYPAGVLAARSRIALPLSIDAGGKVKRIVEDLVGR